VLATLDEENSATGCVGAIEAGATEPKADVALMSRLAAASETERMRFFAIDRSLTNIDLIPEDAPLM
jgi:hypothetical protein